jgi:hypothetical protein
MFCGRQDRHGVVMMVSEFVGRRLGGCGRRVRRIRPVTEGQGAAGVRGGTMWGFKVGLGERGGPALTLIFLTPGQQQGFRTSADHDWSRCTGGTP